MYVLKNESSCKQDMRTSKLISASSDLCNLMIVVAIRKLISISGISWPDK